MVLVHDYELMLLPAMIRGRFPDAPVGFFCHCPFPSSEYYRMLPAREALLRGALGADLISFNHFDYVRHFLNACMRVRSRRPVVLWCLHFIHTTRVHLTMTWVVSFLILRPFGPNRDAPRRSSAWSPRRRGWSTSGGWSPCRYARRASIPEGSS